MQPAQTTGPLSGRSPLHSPKHIDLFEAHDAFNVMAALSLEAAGFAERGTAPYRAQEGEYALNGRLPISTMGGLTQNIGGTGATVVTHILSRVA
ncbi:MAG: hypothetical protein JNM70_12990 [Anaerolineae bacterium]|nr:hypothetical protein [Anaerolineae bacterium]